MKNKHGFAFKLKINHILKIACCLNKTSTMIKINKNNNIKNKF